MLLITKRKKIGEIGGHKIYAITKREMIPIPNPTVRTFMAHSKNENRSFVNSACRCNMSLDSKKIAAFSFIHFSILTMIF